MSLASMSNEEYARLLLGEELKKLHLVIACLLAMHGQRGMGERSVAFGAKLLTDGVSEQEILDIFKKSKEVFCEDARKTQSQATSL